MTAVTGAGDQNLTLSTAPDQTAVTVGVLRRTWMARGRRWFHYVTEAPLPNALPFLSARYAMRCAAWHGIGVDLYYDPAEASNVDRMLRTVRDALAFDTEHFGPYPYRQLRVAVVPYNYAFAAEAFPGVVVARESGPVGPEAPPPRAGALDPTYVLLAHKISHEWWGVQEDPANARGLNLNYRIPCAVLVVDAGEAALRRPGCVSVVAAVAERLSAGPAPCGHTGIAAGRRGRHRAGVHLLRQGCAGVLRPAGLPGRGPRERRVAAVPGRRPLQGPVVSDRGPVLGAAGHRGRAALAMLVDDLFRRIAVFDNRMVLVSATRLPDGRYRVSMRIHAAEYHANGRGAKVPARLAAPMEVGIFTEPADVALHHIPPLYLARVPLRAGGNTLTVTVAGKPRLPSLIRATS